MKKSLFVSALAAGCSLLFAVGGMAQTGQTQQRSEQEREGYSQERQQEQRQQGQQQAQQEQKSQYAKQLMTANEIEGMKIQNRQGEEIGDVDKVVLDSQSGQIGYVVVTSGGFWGMGGEKAVIPWKAVQLQQQGEDTDEAFLTVDVTEEQLMNAPQGDIQEVLDRQQAQEIHQHYGVAPYWEGQQEGQQGQQQKEMQMQQKEERKELQQQQKEERKEQQ